MKVVIIIAFSFLYSLNVIAQESEIKAFFTSYIDEINNLNQTKDMAKVMAYFNPDFQINSTFIGPNGRVDREQRSLADFASTLQGLASSDRDIKTNLKIEQISKIIEGPNTAMISAVLSLNMNVDGNFAEEAGMVTNYAMVKDKDGQWKFVHSDAVRTLVKRNAGSCPCRFYKRESSLVAEFYYPAGFEYRRELEAFKFNSTDKKRVISNNLKEYTWDQDGTVYLTDNGNLTKIGEASNEEEASKVILGQLYNANCLSFSRY